MGSSSISSILEGLALTGKEFRGNKAGSREALIEHSRALIAALEIPSEFMQRCFAAEPAMLATVRIAVDVKLFKYLRDAGDAGLVAETLSERTGLDVVLLQRLIRHLVAMHVVAYHDNNRAFSGTPLSDALAAENYQDSIVLCYDTAIPAFKNFPRFFKKTNYRPPAPGSLEGPFQDAHNSKLAYFDWLATVPPYLQHFNSFMGVYRAGKANWYDPSFYSVSEQLIAGFDSSASDILLVDIGGGRGHDLAGFAVQYPSHPGSLVLQDRDHVIADVVGSSECYPFRAEAYDFFTPQPLKAARAYFLHSVIHDWDDEGGIKILKNLAPALKKGYSRVLLNEIVVGEKPTLAATTMDMIMLAHFSVRERTEADWNRILVEAGLQVVKIYTYSGVAESLIEAELI